MQKNELELLLLYNMNPLFCASPDGIKSQNNEFRIYEFFNEYLL